MAVVIIDVNEVIDSNEFFPYDDSRSSIIRDAAEQTALTTSSSNLGIDTRTFDQFRQGIEINTQKYRVQGTGAKIWAGNIKGYTTTRTLGQALSFTEFFNTKIFKDTQQKFDPVDYIELGNAYPFPIIFNEGPQQNKESYMAPFTIPFREGLGTNEGSEPAHDIRASLEDGNQDLRHIDGKTSQITQFLDLRESNDIVPFLDEGKRTFGDTVSGSITIDGFLNEGEEYITPYDDTGNYRLIAQLSSSNASLLTILKNSGSDINLDEDIREKYDIKSMAAGFDVYGINQARYGTDSITYVGLTRGS